MERSIVIIDCGGQYAHLIGSRVRRLGAYSEIVLPETPAEQLRDAAGVILSGGPQSVYEAGSPQPDAKIFDLGIPILGLCYGHQWIAHALGGRVEPGKVKEYGHTEISIVKHATIFTGLPKQFIAWMSHGDEVVTLPAGFEAIARSETCPIASMADEKRKIYSTQFHVEVTHTEYGNEILRNFVELCHPAPWSMESYAKHIGEQIKKEVGDRLPFAKATGGKNVFMLVSGGVDSTVAFTLLNEVLGPDRVQGLLIDTGLMRKDEVRIIQKALAKLKIKNLHVVDASEEFLKNLKDVYDPEEKRKIIGDTFLAVQRRVSEEMNLRGEGGWMLGQGTIYPDTIETGGTRHADQIKTHHNRVPAIQALIEKNLVIEPLKELYKDEVRKLGEEIGLPHDLVWRHPFPGPGLGVRILCAKEKSPMINDPACPAGRQLPIEIPYRILPLRSVGVQGDGRTYRHAVVLFSHNPFNPDPAHWKLATTIPNTNREINRVLLCTSHNAPVDFVVTPGFITRERAELLREADAIVDHELQKAGIAEKVWQFPVVLLPIGLREGGQSIVLRPVESQEAMTANAANLPEALLESITTKLMKLRGIDAVLYDLTNKPPGTIEWE